MRDVTDVDGLIENLRSVGEAVQGMPEMACLTVGCIRYQLRFSKPDSEFCARCLAEVRVIVVYLDLVNLI